MRILAILGLMPALCMLCAATVNAATTIYTIKSEWEAALGGQFLTENFSDSQLNSGVSFSSFSSGTIITDNPTGNVDGHYHDVLPSTNPNDPWTTWNFIPGINAYGGDWTLAGGGGSGNSLNVYMGDATYVGSISSNFNGQFWGFISDSPFNSVTLKGSTGDQQQNYSLDNMVYAPVPVPAAVWLFGPGLAGLVGLARSKAHA